MIASELAFLGLGLLLGAASGAALIVVLGSRPTRREIRVTVTRDAVPRRSGTLSNDAFIASAAEPARGGPADRRSFDRDLPPADLRIPALVPVMAPPLASQRFAVAPRWTPAAAPDRTAVPFLAAPATARAAGGSTAVGVASRIEAEAGPEVLLEPAGEPTPGTSRIERILRGEHLAMVEAVDAVAGEDSFRRRDWELLLGGFVAAMADMAARESVIDFPMGTAFWDTFTVEQCRQIVGALASMGFHYDGRSGWMEHHVPVYRDLSIALADIGVDPRRVRAWPNQAEIAALFIGARPAAEELLAAAGPDYTTEAVKALVGEHASGLAGLWLAWDDVRPALFAASRPARASV